MATGLAALPATAATANYAEDEDTVPVGLGGLSAEDTEEDVPEMSLAAMRSRQRQARSALEEAFKLGEERLLSARGPSQFERSLALSEDLVRPRKVPGAGGTIGALAAAMRKYEQGGRESAEALADKRATFALDKAKSLAGSDAEYDKLIAQYMNRQATTNRPKISVDTLGRGVTEYDPTTNRARLIPFEGMAEAPGAPTIVRKDGREFMVKNEGTPKEEYVELDAPKDGGPVLPVQALNKKTTLVGEAGTFINAATKADELASLIESGGLKLGLGENIASRAKILAGKSDDNALRFSELERYITASVNDVLNLAKGSQTEGDARRAVQQIMKDLNDPKNVASGLRSLNKIMVKAAGIRDAQVRGIYRNYNADPISVWEELGVEPPAGYTLPATQAPPPAANRNADRIKMLKEAIAKKKGLAGG